MVNKFLAALVGAIALAVAGALSDNHISVVEWIQIVIAVATAVQVWITANVPTLTWAKTATAVVLGVANVLIGAIADGFTASDVAVLVVAALTAAGVYGAPNRSRRTRSVPVA